MIRGTAELQRPVPLYMQVVRQIRAQIASGELAEGERIPSQREMMQHWRISMQTASKVIGALKTEGLAIPSVGRDTIVAPGAGARIAAASAGTAQAADETSQPPGLETRATATMTAAPPDVAEILGIPAGQQALRRAETSLDMGTPSGVSVLWFPPAITAGAPRLADDKPLPAGALAYIAEAAGSQVARVHEETAVMTADEDAAEALGLVAGSPVLLRRERFSDVSGQLIAYSETTVTAGHWRSRTYIIAGAR